MLLLIFVLKIFIFPLIITFLNGELQAVLKQENVYFWINDMLCLACMGCYLRITHTYISRMFCSYVLSVVSRAFCISVSVLYEWTANVYFDWWLSVTSRDTSSDLQENICLYNNVGWSMIIYCKAIWGLTW